jgi:hypothetical protein
MDCSGVRHGTHCGCWCTRVSVCSWLHVLLYTQHIQALTRCIFLPAFIFNVTCLCIVTIHYFFFKYEPELFPGLVYRMESPKVVLLIFVSGKIVITGAKVCNV